MEIIYFAYQRVTNNTFLEDFANVINEQPHIGYFFLQILAYYINICLAIEQVVPIFAYGL